MFGTYNVDVRDGVESETVRTRLGEIQTDGLICGWNESDGNFTLKMPYGNRRVVERMLSIDVGFLTYNPLSDRYDTGTFMP